jgi:hypothetical protein
MRRQLTWIRREWWETRKQWVYYARQHSCLLLQCMTTNSIESWHKSFKSQTEDRESMTQFSLADVVLHVMKIVDQWEQRDENEVIKFRTTRTVECTQYSKLALFLELMQLLIVDQLKDAMKVTDEEKSLKSELDDDLICQCLFYRSYQLFCRHIWQYHFFHDVITDRDWRRWVNMFENSDFEIYEFIIKTYVIKKIHDVIDELNKHTLKMREITTARSIRQHQ